LKARTPQLEERGSFFRKTAENGRAKSRRVRKKLEIRKDLKGDGNVWRNGYKKICL